MATKEKPFCPLYYLMALDTHAGTAMAILKWVRTAEEFNLIMQRKAPGCPQITTKELGHLKAFRTLMMGVVVCWGEQAWAECEELEHEGKLKRSAN